MITCQFDLNSAKNPLDRYWELCVGSCHAATALRADYREMLTRCRRELGFRYLRFHGLFDDDMSVVKKPLFSDRLVLSFTNIDNIYDFLLSIGMKPFVELGFMPGALASADSTVFHYRGNTTPPADYEKWKWFIREFITHIIDRYGLLEVRQWFFEVWNEPNLGGPGSPYGFWAADRDEYFRFYRATALAVKECDAALRVGGPATSNNAWIPEFLDFCQQSGAPVDFVSTHHYPTDVVLGYGVEDSANFVNPLNVNDSAQVQNVMRMAKEGGEEFEEFKKQYSVFQSQIWAHVDRGVLTRMTKRALSEARGLPLYYTEWGSLAGLESDGAFGASFIAKTVLDGVGLARGYSFWTFCDIIEENGQESDEFFGGFGLMTQHGIPKAPYRAFELLHTLQGDLLEQVCREKTVDVYAVHNAAVHALQLLAVNHNSLLHELSAQDVSVTLFTGKTPDTRPDSIPPKGASRAEAPRKKCVRAEIVRLDDTHGNACGAWLSDGARQYLTQGDIQRLQGVSELKREPQPFENTDSGVQLAFTLPPMGTALITVYFE